MKILLLTITFLLSLNSVIGQRPTNINGFIVDENGNPISNAMIHYGEDYVRDDTAYSNKQGRFKVAYPNPQRFWYSFTIQKNGFLPKTFFIDLSTKDIALRRPFIIRSRKGFWYNAKEIDSTHLGIKVKDALSRYKLDIDECLLWDEPPGNYHNFTSELGDSSYITFTFKGVFTTEKRLKITDVLDKVITGIGIGFTNGTEREFGNGYARQNPYFVERQMKMEKQ
jgi:hypothetical protein